MTEKHEFDYYYESGMRLLAAEDVSGAIEAFTTSIALKNDAKAMCYRGLAYFTLKEYDKALADYTRAIQINDVPIPESTISEGRSTVYWGTTRAPSKT